MINRLIAGGFCWFARLLTGLTANWIGTEPNKVARIYYANHSSHGDFLLIWASLPDVLRPHTRPVAGKDYWDKGPIRRFLIQQIFHGVLLDRSNPREAAKGLDVMAKVLDGGESLILFPEGTRNQGTELQPFKGGIHHLAQLRPEIELVPVWIENIGRVMPKGTFVPVPLLCSIRYGAPLLLQENESKKEFLTRLENALKALSAQ